MNFFKFITYTKNFIKAGFNYDTWLYSWMQKFYRKFLFPIERTAWKNKRKHGFESEEALHMCSLLPRKTIDIVIKNCKPKTWLDVGCGTGTALKYVQKKGIKITGIEFSKLAIKTSNLKDKIVQHDLTKPINLSQVFDVVWCYEVAEHLPEKSSDEFVKTLVKHGNIIVLSAATPGQGGEGHLNEQLPIYWIQKLNKLGFKIDEILTSAIHSTHELYSDNVHCFRKTSV